MSAVRDGCCATDHCTNYQVFRRIFLKINDLQVILTRTSTKKCGDVKLIALVSLPFFFLIIFLLCAAVIIILVTLLSVK